MMDLISLVLTLRPLSKPGQEEHVLPLWWGRAAHALLLQVIRATDGALAQSLHEDQGVRPFTTSSLLGRTRRGELDADSRYRLRLTASRSDISAILHTSVQPGGMLSPGAQVELDYHPFGIETSICQPVENPWANHTGYQELAAARLVAPEAPARHIAFHFASPTGFRSNDRVVPIPLPDLLFGSLLERWNSFAPVTFPQDAKRYAAECLAVSRYHLQSRSVPVKNGGLRIGAVGEISYTALTYDRYWLSVLHTLADFALYSGAGIGAAMGFGQCRSIAVPDIEGVEGKGG